MSRILHISLEEIKRQSNQIFKPIKYGENGIGICYPCCKISYNLSCFLENKAILKRNLGALFNKFLFIPITLEPEENGESFIEKITEYLQSKKIRLPKTITFANICKSILDHGKDPYFFLLEANVVKITNLKTILQLVHSSIIRSGRTGTMIFFESTISNEKLTNILKENNKFLQNIIYFPSYTLSESRKFLINLAESWNISVPQNTINILVQNLGGSLWLLREGLRQIRENKKITINDILMSPGIQLRLEKIYALFSTEEKIALVTLCSNDQKYLDPKIKQHLLSTGIISANNKKLPLTIPALLPFIQKDEIANKFNINIDSKKIQFNNKDVSIIFTDQEYDVLLLLIKNRNKITTRENIAQIMWKKEWEDKYSEWAIDKLISRLRSKLFSISKNRSILQTVKTKGVIFS